MTAKNVRGGSRYFGTVERNVREVEVGALYGDGGVSYISILSGGINSTLGPLMRNWGPRGCEKQSTKPTWTSDTHEYY